VKFRSRRERTTRR